MGIKLDPKELRALDKTLKGLGDRGYRKTVRRASGKAMTPAVSAMRKRAPKKTGTLKKSIGKKTKTYNSGVIVTVAGPRLTRRGTDAKDSTETRGQVAHLIEFGHRIVSKTGVVSGFVKPKPFMRPAWDATASIVESKFTKELEAGIVKESSK